MFCLLKRCYGASSPWLLSNLALAHHLLRVFLPSHFKASGPRPWPILGNLPLLHAHSATPHHSLALLSRLYGPIYTFHFGSFPTPVISSPSLAKELLQTHDKNFSDRPPFGMSQHMLYGQNNGNIFARYGAKWRELRKLFTLELFTQKKLQEYEHVRQEEIVYLIQFIERQSRERAGYVEVRECLVRMAGNIVGRMVVSTPLVNWATGSGNELHELLAECSGMSVAFLVGDYVPFLGRLDWKTKCRMREAHQRLDKYLSKIVEGRWRKAGGSILTDDFLDLLLRKTDSDTMDFISPCYM